MKSLVLALVSNVSFKLLSLAPSVAVRIVIHATTSKPSKANDKRHRRIMTLANLIVRMIRSSKIFILMKETHKRTKIDLYGDPHDYISTDTRHRGNPSNRLKAHTQPYNIHCAFK